MNQSIANRKITKEGKDRCCVCRTKIATYLEVETVVVMEEELVEEGEEMVVEPVEEDLGVALQ